MGGESIFSLLKNLKNQGKEDDWEIIDGEFYYKGQVMSDEDRIKIFEEDLDDFIKRVDNKLYTAKNNGRNRVEC